MSDQGVWTHAEVLPTVAPPDRVTLGEGGTPIEEVADLAAYAGLQRLLLKREDTNPTGSHKDRAAAVQISRCRAEGQMMGVISSSGNAALAAATYGAAAGVRVVAFISPLTGTVRALRLGDAGARVIVTTKPINYSLRLARVTGWPDLRPSVSADAVSGFRTLGIELARELPAQMPIFGYASSGTTFEALGQVFAASPGDHPLHPVQAGLINGLSQAFGRSGDGRRSVVGDLGVKVTPRASAVIDMVRRSGGQAWWVADTEIVEARGALERAGIDAAPECWAALAGIRAAVGAGGIEEACLLLTGRSWGESGDELQPDATSFAEVLSLVADLR